MALLQVEKLGHKFDSVVALSNVSFDIEPGEIAGIIGPNGSGKTTLINLITGLYRAGEGAIRFGGAPITGLRLDQIACRGIARTFQNIRLFEDLTVLDNVLAGMDRHIACGFFAALCGFPSIEARDREAKDMAHALLEMVSDTLAAKAASIARHLPYADKRRLEIARALASRPRLLLLDEPAAGMSPAEIRSLIGRLERLAGTGLTIMLVEHKMRLIEGVTNRVIVLDSGQKIADGTFETVRCDPHVVSAYLGKDYLGKDDRGADHQTVRDIRVPA